MSDSEDRRAEDDAFHEWWYMPGSFGERGTFARLPDGTEPIEMAYARLGWNARARAGVVAPGTAHQVENKAYYVDKDGVHESQGGKIDE